MILLRLRGGLGNQLFQYAAGKALALHHQVPFKLDTYYYKRHPYRKVAIDKFNTQYEVAQDHEIARFVGRTKLHRLFHKKTNYRYCQKAFAQPYYHFYPKFFELPNDVYLSGYFQSEKYFLPYAQLLRKEFTPAATPNEKNAELIQQIREVASVSIHVRHGDYASSKNYYSFFGTLDPSYYQSAVQKIREKIMSPHFFVFSDNIPWCRQQFSNLLGEAVFVDHNKGEQSYWDMVLMAQCQHNIIANSSFSWWGAWLNNFPKKTVIAPEKWFRSTYYQGRELVYMDRIYDLKDQLPDGWIRL